MQYKTGTVSVTNGSAIVTGTGTSWLAEITAGDLFTVAGDNVPYTVGSVASDTQITLSANYAGITASGKAYALHRDFTADGLPLLYNGDIETGTIFTRAMAIIQNHLTNWLNGLLDLSGVTDKPTARTNLGLAIGVDVAAYVKNNDIATTDPGVNDDSSAGYSVRSLWVNTSTTECFRCLDASVGAAVWETTTLTIDELGTMATQDASAVTITGGTATGLTFIEITETQHNLTGTVIDPANGSVQYKTLTGNTTFTESMEDGQAVLLMIDDGTAYTITWPTITWVGGAAPTLPTTGYAVIALWQTNGVLYGNHVGDA